MPNAFKIIYHGIQEHYKSNDDDATARQAAYRFSPTTPKKITNQRNN